MAETVLVTGGAGFIGTRTARLLLERGYRVRVADALTSQIHGDAAAAVTDPDVEFLRADVRDADAMARAVRGVDAVVHLAAETSVGQSMVAADHHVDVNVRGTAVVLRAVRESARDVRSFVLASSRAVYGEGRYACDACGPVEPGPRSLERLLSAAWEPPCPTCGGPLRPAPTPEDARLAPSSVYGMTKAFAEQVGLLDAVQHGTSVSLLRYFNVYGAGQAVNNPYTGLLMTFAARLVSGKPIVLYEHGLPVRDLVHVDDVAAANVAALEQPAPGVRTLNIGSGQGIPLRRIAEALGDAFGARPRIEVSSRFRVGDIFASIADIEAARSTLRWAPRVDLRTGLAGLRAWIGEQVVDDRSDAVESEMRREGVLRG